MFITFEGIDCSGKSTQARKLASWLRETGYDVVELREPGNTVISEQIREILLNNKTIDLNDRTELMLFAAARAQLVDEVILPSLADGKIVICDRFSDSTIAYQGYGRGLPLEEIVHVNRIATQETVPDVTFYLDISPETALSRCGERPDEEADRIEGSGTHFFERVIKGYMHLADMNSGRYYVVDGGEEIDHIQSILRRLTEQRINSHNVLTTKHRNSEDPVLES